MVNKVTLIGYLGRDPELRSTQGGKSVASLRVATSEKYKNKDGEMVETTEWHSVVLWEKDAENAHKYLQKGSPVYIEGKLQTRKWQDKQGNDRYTTEVVVQGYNSTIKYLPDPKRNERGGDDRDDRDTRSGGRQGGGRDGRSDRGDDRDTRSGGGGRGGRDDTSRGSSNQGRRQAEDRQPYNPDDDIPF